jgi:hypothetical protein
MLGVLSLVAVLAVGANGRTSQSRPEPSLPEVREQLREEIAALETRVRNLEDHVRTLEQRNAEKVSSPAPQFVASEPRNRSQCNQPQFLDDRGVWRFRLECLAESRNEPCNPPFSIDPRGIKRVNPTCFGPDR